MTPSSPPADEPVGYRFVLPPQWWAVDLHPDRTAASAAALVERQWRGVDDAPHLKAQARQLLVEQSEAARRAGGLELHLSVGTLQGVPLTASLLVSAHPLDARELAGLAQARLAQGAEVGPVQLPAGPALRARWTQASPADGLPAELDGEPLPVTTCLDLHLPVPGAARVLLLSFRTPLEPLAGPLVELFDAVAATLRWTGRSPSGARPASRFTPIAEEGTPWETT